LILLTLDSIGAARTNVESEDPTLIFHLNIFDLKPEAIRNVKVKTTIVGGKVVYAATPNP
jgi:hypothetical protein